MEAVREACDYIDNIARFSVKNSNAHTRMCLDALGAPDRSFRVIHVAGTNGKGSVCSYLTSVLTGAGMKTALFTSPHLVRVNERMRIGMRPVPDEDFVRVFREVREAVERLTAAGEAHPSYFEFLFLMACVWFREQGAEIAVMETGLGGRLDATSSIGRPDLCVITQIGFDHMKYLGDTIPEIAAEKAGIIRPGVPVVYDAACPDAARVIRENAGRLGSDAFSLLPSDYEIETSSPGKIDFCTAFRYDGRARYTLRTYAPYQVQNAALSLLALKVLAEREPAFYGRVTAAQAAEGLAGMKWPARMEQIAPRVFLDGAHNQDGIRRFVEAAELIRDGGRAVLIFSAVNDKDYSEMIRILAEEVPWSAVIVTEIDGARKTLSATLRELFAKYGRPDAEVLADFGEAYRAARKLQGSGCLFICGSLYLAGTAEEYIHDQL